MSRSLQLTYTPQRAENQGYKYTITTVGTNMPSEVFVMRRRPLDPLRNTQTTLYDHVATVTELGTLPVNAPLAGQAQYRVASFDLVCPTRDEADDNIAALRSELNSLIRALNAGDQTLDPVVVVLTG
jgi:hypothetical protein